MEHRRCTSIGQQKRIAIEMWQYIKAQIEQSYPMYTITTAKKEWLKNNYPDIQWKNYCLLCDIYLEPSTTDNGSFRWECPDCPLSKKYKGLAPYGCSFDDAVTPWSKIVDYEYKREEALKACDEIIETLESLQGGEEFS